MTLRLRKFQYNRNNFIIILLLLNKVQKEEMIKTKQIYNFSHGQLMHAWMQHPIGKACMTV